MEPMFSFAMKKIDFKWIDYVKIDSSLKWVECKVIYVRIIFTKIECMFGFMFEAPWIDYGCVAFKWIVKWFMSG